MTWIIRVILGDYLFKGTFSCRLSEMIENFQWWRVTVLIGIFTTNRWLERGNSIQIVLLLMTLPTLKKNKPLRSFVFINFLSIDNQRSTMFIQVHFKWFSCLRVHSFDIGKEYCFLHQRTLRSCFIHSKKKTECDGSYYYTYSDPILPGI